MEFLKLFRAAAPGITPLVLSVGPLVVAKPERKHVGVDGALEGLLGLLRQAIPTGIVTALSHLPKPAQDALRRVAAMWGIPLSPDGTAVTVVLEPTAAVAPLALGAREAQASPLGLQKVVVPLGNLESFLAQVAGRAKVRLPFEPIPMSVTSEGANLVGASLFHAQGIRGAGVKIAVIDVGFQGLSASQARGDLPYALVTRDFTGTGIDTGLSHGTAVAEIVYDIAPESTLYLVKIANEVDLDNAVFYCIAEGVHVIVHALGWFNTSFYDGTGVIAQIVNRAAQAGILWVQAAGNFGRRHYGPTFTDANADGWHDAEVTLTAQAGERMLLYLTWDSWPESPDDYDLYLFDPAGNLLASSTKTQAGAEQPTERIYATATGGTYRVKIQKVAGATKRLALFSVFHDLSPYDPAASLVTPADVDAALSVAAIGWQNYTTGPAQVYSSRGPTKDGRQKPDLAGPDSVSTGVSYYSPFVGTSAAAPHVAGIAALIKAETSGLTLAQLRSRILAFCVPMGDPYTYGAGRLEARPQAVALPDLVVNSITHSPTNPTVGSTVSFSVVVRNQGTAPAGQFAVRLQGGGPAQDRTVSSLPAGASVTLSFSLPLSTSPETFTATADILNQVAESNEGNNTRQVTITAQPAPRGTLATDRSSYAQGETVQIIFRNTGTVAIHLPNTAPWVIKDAWGRVAFAPAAAQVITIVNPGETRTWTWDQRDSAGNQVPAGSYTVEFRTQNAGTFTAQFTIQAPVALPDLVVDSISYSPTAPTVGTTITFQIRVRNQGGAPAGLFYVALSGLAGTQYASVSSLPARASATVTLELPLSTPSETFTATVDATNRVREGNETNNTREITITAAQPPLSLTIQTDKSTYTVGEPVRIAITISRPSYVYVVELDPTGRAILIFPNYWERDPRLAAGTTWLPRLATYQIRASEPTGRETIFAFASDQAIPLFPTTFSPSFPVLSTNGSLFLSQVRAWLSGNVPAGGWAEASTLVTINPLANQPPIASFTFSPASPLVNQWITFDATSSRDPDGRIVSFAWDFGDGATARGSRVQKRYSAPGTYTVTLTVTDDRGASASSSQTVTVTVPNQAPRARFTFSPTNPEPGQAVTFDAGASFDPDGAIVSYAWNFGDGTTGSGVTVTKAYSAAGRYTVTLTVRDDRGATGQAQQTVQVGPPPATLPGMPVIDRPGIYVWGDPNQHWHITVAGDPSWPTPRKFQVILESQGTFANRAVTGAAPAPTLSVSGGVTKLSWEGTVGADWVDLQFDLVGATLMKLWLYLDTDGDGVPKPKRVADAKAMVYLRTCKTNPPGNPFAVYAERGATALLPLANFRISVVYEDGSVSPVSWSIEHREEEAGCR